MPSEENPPITAPEVFSLTLRPSPGETYLAKAHKRLFAPIAKPGVFSWEKHTARIQPKNQT